MNGICATYNYIESATKAFARASHYIEPHVAAIHHIRLRYYVYDFLARLLVEVIDFFRELVYIAL